MPGVAMITCDRLAACLMALIRHTAAEVSSVTSLCMAQQQSSLALTLRLHAWSTLVDDTGAIRSWTKLTIHIRCPVTMPTKAARGRASHMSLRNYKSPAQKCGCRAARRHRRCHGSPALGQMTPQSVPAAPTVCTPPVPHSTPPVQHALICQWQCPAHP